MRQPNMKFLQAILAGAIVLILAATAPALAQAQDAQLLVPQPISVRDINGVDLLYGTFSDSPAAISVGPSGLGLVFQAVMTDRGVWTHNLSGGVVESCVYDETIGQCTQPPVLNVSIGGLQGVNFFEADGVWKPTNGQSSTLVNSGGVWIYTSHDGHIATFSSPPDVLFEAPYSSIKQKSLATITSIVNPSGEVYNYFYKFSDGISVLSSVISTRGYQIFIEYLGGEISRATAINNAIEHCVPTAATCATSSDWPHLNFVQSSSTREVEDSLGGRTVYRFTRPESGARIRRITGVRRAGRSSGWNLEIDYYKHVPINPFDQVLYGHVISVRRDLDVWKYSEPGSGSQLTDPLGNISQYEIRNFGGSSSTMTVLKSITNTNGGVTTNAYDVRPGIGPVLLSVMQPEGNKIVYSYDARGNVTEERAVSKTPGTPVDVVRRATYPATCANPITCNLPTSVTDAQGGVTDYTYDAVGNLLTVTGPAPTLGAARPQTRYVWEQRYAWYKQNGSSAITRAATPVWVQVSQSQCMMGATC